MAILTHGSDLRLAPTIGPLVKHGDGTVREALAKLGKLGFAAVQLDASLPGIRPRDLSARARKDLVALCMRQGVPIAGVELFIPRRHYLDPAQIDRAMAATLAAIALAADLGRLPMSLALPVKDLATDALAAIIEAADGHDVRLAVHAEDQLDELTAWLAKVDQPVAGAGIDPAVLLTMGHDPAQAIHRLAAQLAVGRLSDVTSSSGGMGGARCDVGSGELDVIPYRLALDLAKRRVGPVVLDLRGLSNPLAAATAARKSWADATFDAR